MSSRYATTRDFRAALDARLKTAARNRNQPLIQMRQSVRAPEQPVGP